MATDTTTKGKGSPKSPTSKPLASSRKSQQDISPDILALLALDGMQGALMQFSEAGGRYFIHEKGKGIIALYLYLPGRVLGKQVKSGAVEITCQGVPVKERPQ